MVPPYVDHRLAAPGPSPRGMLAVPRPNVAAAPAGTYLEQTVALFAAAGISLPLLYGLDPTPGLDVDSQPDISHASGRITAIGPAGTEPLSAAQGTSSRQPLYVANAINGRPGLYFDQNDQLSTLSYDPGSATTAILFVFYQRPASPLFPILGYFPVTFGDTATPSGGSIGILGNPSTGETNVVACYPRDVATPFAKSAATYPMTTAGMVVGTGDFTRADNKEAEIRIYGANASATYGAGNNLATYKPNVFTIGGRPAGTFGFEGWACGWGVGFITGTLTAAHLSAVAAVEALWAATWAAP